MPTFGEFLMEHWILSTAFVFLLTNFLMLEWQSRQGDWVMSAEKVVLWMNRENPLILDTRDRDTFDKGHIVKSQHLPSEDKQALMRLKKYQKRPVLLVGTAERRSANTLREKLLAQGFQEVKWLSGGMAAWQSEGFPVVKNA